MFTKLTIGVTEQQLIYRQVDRTSYVIFNNSAANTLYIGEKGQGTNGFPIKPLGSISFKIPEDDTTGELWGIASGAGTDIRIYEGYGLG